MENLQDLLNKFSTNPDFITDQKVFLTSKRKKIYQFDRQGNFMCEYKSINEASKQTGIERHIILGALNTNKQHFSGGYFWSVNKNEVFDTQLKYQHNVGYLVYNSQGTLMGKFKTQDEIRKTYDLNKGSVSLVLGGKRPHTKGLVIKYEK